MATSGVWESYFCSGRMTSLVISVSPSSTEHTLSICGLANPAGQFWWMASTQSLNNKTTKFMFAGINLFWACFPGALRRTQDIFMPKNINCITVIISVEGIEKVETKKNDKKTVWRIFLSPTLQENVNTVLASRSWLAAYIVRLFAF